MRVRQSLLHFGTNALLMGVTMVVALKVTPLLTDWVGKGRLGGYKVVQNLGGYLSLLELGLAGALGPMLARAIGKGDSRALHETVAAGSRAYVGVSLVAFAVGLAMTPFVHWFTKGIVGPALIDLRTAWVVSLIALPTLVLLPMRSLVDAKQIGYVINLLLLAQSLLITGLSLVFARYGWGITGQATAQVTGVWVYSLVLATFAYRSHPGMLRATLTARVTPETRRDLWSLSMPSMLLNVSGRISVLSDSILIGSIMKTSLVLSLDYTQKLITIGQMALQAIGGATWAALADLHHKGERESFNRRLVEMTRLVAVLGVIGFVPVVVYNRAFFRIWVGWTGVPYGGDLVTVVAVVNAVMLAEQSLWIWVFSATGRIREVVGFVFVGAVINLAASVALTYQYGLVGPLLGSTVGFLGVGMWALPWRLNQKFGTPLGEMAWAFLKPVAVGTAMALALRAMVGTHEPAGWSGLITEVSLATLAMLAVSVALLLTPEDRATWMVRVRGLLGR